MARSLTVPCTARWPAEPPGKRRGLTTIGVGAERQALTRGQVEHGGVGLGRAVARAVLGCEGGEEDGVEQGGRRLAAGPVGQGDDLVAQRGRRRRKASMRPKTAASRLSADAAPVPAGASDAVPFTAPCPGHRRRLNSAKVSLDRIPQGQRQGFLGLLNPVDALGAHDQAVVGRHRSSAMPDPSYRTDRP